MITWQYQLLAIKHRFGYNGVSIKSKVSDELDYVAFFYPGDAEAWRWINENTRPDEKIATFDIRYYYIERDVLPLDGSAASKLYGVSIDEDVRLLQELGVKYIFSTSWASPMSYITPPAYYALPLTKFLGDPKWFPVVFSRYSSAVYHVGPLNISELIEEAFRRREILPILNENISFTLNRNDFSDGLCILNIHIPADYHGRIILEVKTRTDHEIYIAIIKGVNPENGRAPMVESKGRNPSLSWLVMGGAYSIIFKVDDADAARISVNVRLRSIF
jgi:hypothetical protein